MMQVNQMLSNDQWAMLGLSLVPLFIIAGFYKHHKTKFAEASFLTSLTGSLMAFASVALSAVFILSGIVLFGFATYTKNHASPS